MTCPEALAACGDWERALDLLRRCDIWVGILLWIPFLRVDGETLVSGNCPEPFSVCVCNVSESTTLCRFRGIPKQASTIIKSDLPKASACSGKNEQINWTLYSWRHRLKQNSLLRTGWTAGICLQASWQCWRILHHYSLGSLAPAIWIPGLPAFGATLSCFEDAGLWNKALGRLGVQR